MSVQHYINSKNPIYIIIKKIELGLPNEINNINVGYNKRKKHLELVKNFKNKDYKNILIENQECFYKNLII